MGRPENSGHSVCLALVLSQHNFINFSGVLHALRLVYRAVSEKRSRWVSPMMLSPLAGLWSERFDPGFLLIAFQNRQYQKPKILSGPMRSHAEPRWKWRTFASSLELQSSNVG